MSMDVRRRANGAFRSCLSLIALGILGAFAVVGRADDDGVNGHRKVDDGSFVVMTFNTGTTLGLRHDDPPNDEYTSAEARISDEWYGNGLAWRDAIEAVQRFLREVDPDIVAFQEMFYPEECSKIPERARAGFVCETWKSGDESVARVVLGEDYQIAYHPGKPNKCVAVHRRLGTIRGYDEKSTTNWLEGAPVKGCGGGARVARATIDRPNRETLTVISIHGTSGRKPVDQECRVRQIERIFVDFGDGKPGVRGNRNVILGDFNTDPGRVASIDKSAARWNDFVGHGKPFNFISKVGVDAPRAYQGFVDIDHVVSDTFHGTCHYPGVDQGSEPVFNGVYFDHTPVVCKLTE
jgi:endonuclease/exonuclease/phosphatase family metal-dependent hydrolase